jgi:D-proline reductase (dithiol) PrdB
MSTKLNPDPQRVVDPWRFAGGFLKKVLSARIPDEPSHDPIPWAAVGKPMSQAKVALVSTAGLSMKSDAPFDMEFERKRPTRGDPSWRALRADATSEQIEANHLHIDTGYILRDLNVALPVDRLRECAEAGEIGSVADTHYSIMGYQGNDSSELETQSAPQIAASMQNEAVDLALFAPV